MSTKRTLNKADSFSEAAKYTSRSKFSKGSPPEYQWLVRNRLMDQACSHMVLSPIYSLVRWTPESVFAEAAKYRTRSEFKRESAGAYVYATTNGFLTQVCANMRGQRFWHIFELMAVAIKYTSKLKFMQYEKSAYGFCQKNSLIDIICAHMDQRRSWCKETAMAAAKRCSSRGCLRVLYSGAYKHADQYGYLDEACANMPTPEYGFSKIKPANLYHLRITGPGALEIYKIGITNRDPLARIAGMGLYPGVSAEVLSVIAFENGRDARITEKRLHRKFSSYRYGGPQVMKNGITELFTVNVLDPNYGEIHA